MTRFTRIAILCTASLAVLTLGACRRRPAVTPDPTPTPTVNQDSINRVRDSVAAEDARRRAEQMRRDSIANAQSMTVHEQEALREALTAVVYFDYDDATLREESRAVLDAKIPILLANPSLTVRIAGHTDERGSSEYNLALGQRRAVAVKGYLSTRGVSSNRMEAVSYGEEQPVAEGAMESAWSLNRRAEFEITSPATPLARPRP